ncbi:MFS general substrate transporter [Marasmius fiardii PR-910]|nr:MFS general substrate transporter [Marasmius fiardii PR-910]
MSTSKVPGTFSLSRITSLLACLLCTLGSGTIYVGVYSVYAPQLGAHLHINHTFLNIVGLGGTVGLCLVGPFSGRSVDKHGPRQAFLVAGTLLLLGYSGIRFIYLAGLPEGANSLSNFKLVTLVFCSFMIGVAASFGNVAAVNTTAKTFPDRVRGTTTGMVISGFGLSALIFSTLAHHVTAGDPASLLLLLGVGTSSLMVLGYFFARPIPILSTEDDNATDRQRPESEFRRADDVEENAHYPDSRTPLLSHDSHERRRSSKSSSRPYTTSPIEVEGNLFRRLFVSSDFWLLFCILALLSGTGLMYINNVGSISQVLYVHEGKNSTVSDQDQLEITKWQAAQVSTISFMNFSGRLSIGLLSDFVKTRFGRPRSYLLVLSSFLVLLAQITAMFVDRVEDLWTASTLLGLGYGTVFSLFPALCLEWFGMAHFSENWGYLTLAQLLGGNVFSVAFGRNLDVHEKAPHTTFPLPPSKELRCLDGKACYVDSFRLTTFACLVGMGLSVWAAWKDRKRLLGKGEKCRGDVISGNEG